MPGHHDVRRLGNEDHDEAVSIINTAIDAGINFIDTADVYSRGESEEIVGQALAGRRDRIVLATKVHFAMGADPNEGGNSRRWILRACEDSLRRLNTDYIDLYQVHRPDPDVDIDETLGALTDLVRQGKVRYLGSSKFQPSAIVEAQWAAERRQRERFVCEQPAYSLLVRGIETDFLPTCQRYRMGVIPWGPLAGGWLSGKWRRAARAWPAGGRTASGPIRPQPAGEPAQAGDHRGPGPGGGGRGYPARPPGSGVRTPAPGRHRTHHGPRTPAHLATYLGAP